jgi:predicted kinase
MQKIILTVGIPASGKSFWSKDEVCKDPEGTTRINRDDLRNMMSNYHFCDANEKLVTEASDAILRAALKKGRNIILDETNLTSRNFDKICKVVQELNISAMVMEKPFYIELDEALLRNSKREGTAKIPEEVIHKMWKQSGGKQHKFYKPKVEVFHPQDTEDYVSGPPYDASLPDAIICDLDGTWALFNSIGKNGQAVIKHPFAHSRSPYDASKSDQDDINEPVREIVEAFYNKGVKIIFCSGRENCYRSQTENHIKKHSNIEYQLFMRQTSDQRKDSIIKNELYDKHIKGRYNVKFVLDDRTSVCKLWRDTLGLTCLQVAWGDF